MSSTKTVLAAIDLASSEEQAAVLKRAAQLAELDGAMLAVITVVPDYGMSIVGGFFDENAEKKALEFAKEQLHQIVAEVLGPEAKVKHIIANGSAYEQVLAMANQLNASMIVVGAHRQGFADYLLGPNAGRVVRHATCSVHVVRLDQ